MAQAAKKTVETVEAQVVAGAQDILGWMAWWDLFNVEGERAALVEQFAAIGYEGAVPEEPSPERRLRTAMERVGRAHKIEFKRAGRTNNHVTYRPVEAKQGTDASATSEEHKPTVDVKTLSAISVDRDAGTVTLQDTKCDVGQAVVKEYDRLQGKYTALDVRTAVRAVLEDLFGVRLRNRGGMYFVPKAAGVEETLKGLQNIVGKQGDSDLYMPALPKSGEWVRAAQRRTMRSLDGLYADLMADAEGFVSGLGAGDLANPRSLGSSVEQAKVLKRKVELYNEILEGRGASLVKAAEVVAKTVEEIVEASVEVRSLKKAKDSDKAQEMAKKLLADIAAKATKSLARARKEHAPVEAKGAGDEEEESE